MSPTMPQDGVRLVDVEPRPTAVIAATTAWRTSRSLWPRLLDEVYVFVRRCPEFAAGTAGTSGPHWQNVMLYRDHEPNVEVGVLAPVAFAPQGRVIASELPGAVPPPRSTPVARSRSGRPTTPSARSSAPRAWRAPGSCGRSTAIPTRMTTPSRPTCSTSSLDFPTRKA